MFSGQKHKLPQTVGKRVVLLIGGSGTLGRAFVGEKPSDAFVINVSRKGTLTGENVVNYHHDIRENPEILLRRLAEFVESIDVLIPMAYDRNFSSIEKLDCERFLKEIELDTFLPIRISTLCARYFWSRVSKEANIEKGRKVINISSGAAFEKTARPELASYSGAKAALTIMTEYLHDYLFSSFGVSAHVVAPGSLQNANVKAATVETLWKLEAEPLTRFTLKKIFSAGLAGAHNPLYR